jgi:hypothetical protein
MGITRRRPLAEQWAGKIKAQIGKSVESIIGIGRMLIEAKAQLPHGEWGRMFDDGLLPFSHRSASCLMAIADNPVLSNSHHGANLPPSWRTLYDLARLPEPVLQNAFRDGLITPALERHEVRALLPPQVQAEVLALAADQEIGFNVALPANGLRFARMAVADLEQIELNDVEREDAFAYVRSWLDSRTEIGTT